MPTRRSIPPRSSRPAADHGGADIGGKLREFFDALAATAEDITQRAGSAERATGEIPFSVGGKPGRAVFGYAVRVGLDGVKAERFGDMPPAPPRAGQKRTPPAPAPRAPIVDVFDEGETLRIVAELPGVESRDVRCAVTGDAVEIETTGPHAYRKSVALPWPVLPGSLSQSCRNGILELRLRRADTP